MRIPATLQPENVVGLIDSREQLPLDLSPLKTEVVGLATGDYSVGGMESIVAIERKSEPDLLTCIGKERKRFDAVIQRLLGFEIRAVVVESSWQRMEAGEWNSKITPNQAVGSLIGWIARGVPIVMCGDHQRCGRFVSRLLFTAARRRWAESRALIGEVLEVETEAAIVQR